MPICMIILRIILVKKGNKEQGWANYGHVCLLNWVVFVHFC